MHACAGFIGSTLAKYLSNYHDIITFDVNPNPPLLKQFKNIEHRVCDIRHYKEIKEKIGKPKVVVHTAIVQIPKINEMKSYAYEVNVLGTHNICKAIKKQMKLQDSSYVEPGTSLANENTEQQ